MITEIKEGKEKRNTAKLPNVPRPDYRAPAESKVSVTPAEVSLLRDHITQLVSENEDKQATINRLINELLDAKAIINNMRVNK